MLWSPLKIISLIVALFVVNIFAPLRNDAVDLNKTQVSAVIEQPLLPSVLEAKSACVFDLVQKKFIFELNSEVQVSLASLTKLMTAVVAEENFPESTLVEVSKEAVAMEGDSGLAAGEEWFLPDLINVMLISSSNDAAFAVASVLKNDLKPDDSEFVKLMNRKAEELGLRQTFFLNSSGLDISENLAGAFGSCRDLVNLVIYILINHPGLLDATVQDSVVVNGRVFENTNKSLASLPLLLAGKTGFSDLAGGNLMVVVNKGLNEPVIMAVFSSSFDGRFSDIEMLYNEFIR